MKQANKIVKSYTIEAELSTYIERTRAERSASERVNELLRRGMADEMHASLEAAAREFFRDYDAEDHAEDSELRASALRAIDRE